MDHWKAEVSRSEMTDERSITISLDALNEVPGALMPFRPTLIVRCQEEQLQIYVATGSVLENDGEGDLDMTPVRMRWDSADADTATWDRSTDYTAAFAPDPRAFLSRLLEGHLLRFEFHPFDAAARVARFDTRGLSRHLSPLDAACPPRGVEDSTGAQDAEPAGSDSTVGVFSEDVVQEKPELISAPPLDYPVMLRQAGIQGAVIIQAIVDSTGRVEPNSVRVVSSANPGFDQSAKQHVLESRFRPGRVYGHAVRVLVLVPVNFVIKGH